jgi:hypothetical protein
MSHPLGDSMIKCSSLTHITCVPPKESQLMSKTLQGICRSAGDPFPVGIVISLPPSCDASDGFGKLAKCWAALDVHRDSQSPACGNLLPFATKVFSQHREVLVIRHSMQSQLEAVSRNIGHGDAERAESAVNIPFILVVDADGFGGNRLTATEICGGIVCVVKKFMECHVICPDYRFLVRDDWGGHPIVSAVEDTLWRSSPELACISLARRHARYGNDTITLCLCRKIQEPPFPTSPPPVSTWRLVQDAGRSVASD